MPVTRYNTAPLSLRLAASPAVPRRARAARCLSADDSRLAAEAAAVVAGAL